MTELRDQVLAVLAGQSPDYFAFPNASAFYAEGLDPDQVAGVLAELHAEGRLERELLLDQDEPEAEPIPGGYRLAPGNNKPKRRRKKVSETEQPITEVPPAGEPEAEPEEGGEEESAEEEEGGEEAE
jgi:hypothetical protein